MDNESTPGDKTIMDEPTLCRFEQTSHSYVTSPEVSFS